MMPWIWAVVGIGSLVVLLALPAYLIIDCFRLVRKNREMLTEIERLRAERRGQ